MSIKDNLIKIKEKLHEEDSNIYITELNEDVDKEYLLERIIEEVKRAADYGIIPDIIESTFNLFFLFSLFLGVPLYLLINITVIHKSIPPTQNRKPEANNSSPSEYTSKII